MKPWQTFLVVLVCVGVVAVAIVLPLALIVPDTFQLTSLTYTTGMGEAMDAYLAPSYALYTGTYKRVAVDSSDVPTAAQDTVNAMDDVYGMWALQDADITTFAVLSKLEFANYQVLLLNNEGTKVCYTSDKLLVPNPGMYRGDKMTTALSADAGSYAATFAL